MRYATIALLLGSVAIGAQPARADDLSTPHVLDKVTITGSKTVPTEKLTAALQEKPGDRITKDEIIADRDAIMKVLEASNVGGSVAVSVATKPSTKHVLVTFQVKDQGVQAPTVTRVAAKLHAESFVGNVSIPSDKLATAAGLNPGDELNNDKLVIAQKGIVAAYAAAKLPINVSVAGEPKSVSPGQIDLVWQITETKLKKKRNTEDEGQKVDP